MPVNDTLLIGVDGGATEVKAHAVDCDNLQQPSAFRLRAEAAVRAYVEPEDFTPVPVSQQLAQRDSQNLQLTPSETREADHWTAAAVAAITDIARQCSATNVLVGIGMPGLKTADGRGICVINNGPRIPGYLDAVEHGLAATGISLTAPVAALGSDADYCGLGEEYAAEGLFRDVENAYYVGGGTGVADALKLRGQLVPFDQIKSWIMKAWQIPSALGPTFEKLVSAKSLNRIYADLLNGGSERGDKPRFPEVDAGRDRTPAIAWMETAALVLAELIFERLNTIKSGRQDTAHRGQSYTALQEDHAYRGVLLGRIVIGQRVGQIYANEDFRAVFRERLDAHLAAMITGSRDEEMIAACLTGTPAALRPGFVQPSNLRAAPALGAAVAAVQAYRPQAN